MPGDANRRPFHVMVKPIGPICNLGCTYCYYLGKERWLDADDGTSAESNRERELGSLSSAASRPVPRPGAARSWKMSDESLERFVRDYIAAQPTAVGPDGTGPTIQFAWQGGEPTLLGVEFFRQAVELQKKYAPPGVRVENAFQTNGTLLDDEWCEFFGANDFLIGLSIDGPADLHDAYRRDKGGQPTFGRVWAGLQLLKKHAVRFNALVVVNRRNAQRPRDVYRFLRDQAAVQFIQFIACVERMDFEEVAPQHWDPKSLAGSGAGTSESKEGDSPLFAHRATRGQSPVGVTPWSVPAADYGTFLCGVFDEWVARDVGRVFVQLFDAMLGQWMGLGSALCVFAPTCGMALVAEHDGELFSCDHYVYPEYRLGNYHDTPLAEMAFSDRQLRFGLDKRDTLPDQCRHCRFLFACNGECPKNRFVRTADGQAGLNYLCPGLKKFFAHVDPWMRPMADLVRSGRPAADVMAIAAGGGPRSVVLAGDYRGRDGARSSKEKGDSPPFPNDGKRRQSPDDAKRGPSPRNSPCPCGSGKKFKKCCMGRTSAG